MLQGSNNLSFVSKKCDLYTSINTSDYKSICIKYFFQIHLTLHVSVEFLQTSVDIQKYNAMISLIKSNSIEY